MNARDLILWDLQETRRRFVILCEGIEDRHLNWRPDAEAMSIGEMIRHVFFHDIAWLQILTEGRLPTDAEKEQLGQNAPFNTVAAEVERGRPFHERFLTYVATLDPDSFGTHMVQWPHRPLQRLLGDTLERKSYHDAVHTGQLLQYLRTLQVARPDIWD